MKQQGKQTKRGTSQRPLADMQRPQAKGGMNPKVDQTKPGVGKVGQQPDYGQGATDFHQSNHGRRAR